MEGGDAPGATEAVRPAGPHRAMASRARRRRPLTVLLQALGLLLVPLQVRTRTTVARRPPPPKVQFSWHSRPTGTSRDWEFGGGGEQVRRPQLERGARGRQLEGSWDLEERGLRNPDSDRGSAERGALMVLWFSGCS